MVENNGLHPLPANYTGDIRVQYLTLTQPGLIQQSKPVNVNDGGCSGVTNGIVNGAK